MGGFFTALLGKFVALATWFGNLFKAVFTAAWLLVQDMLTWAFIQFLAVIQTVLDGLPGPDAFAAFNPAQYLSGLTPEMSNMLGMMRIGECLAILLAAILIKLTLQIIPFTRLGS